MGAAFGRFRLSGRSRGTEGASLVISFAGIIRSRFEGCVSASVRVRTKAPPLRCGCVEVVANALLNDVATFGAAFRNSGDGNFFVVARNVGRYYNREATRRKGDGENFFNALFISGGYYNFFK